MGGLFSGGRRAPPKSVRLRRCQHLPQSPSHQIQKMPLKAAHIAKQLVLRMPYPLQIHCWQIKRALLQLAVGRPGQPLGTQTTLGMRQSRTPQKSGIKTLIIIPSKSTMLKLQNIRLRLKLTHLFKNVLPEMITELALQEVDESHVLGGVYRQALSPLSGPRKADHFACAPRFSAQDQGLRSCRRKQILARAALIFVPSGTANRRRTPRLRTGRNLVAKPAK